jgi:BCD family chlorophyll transporter-like MFS transporter
MVKRLLIGVALGSAAFSMQDVLLEPYGGEVLGLSVGQTTLLTALWAAGTLAGFALAGRMLNAGMDMFRLAGGGAVMGLIGFSLVIFAEPLQSAHVFRVGACVIGFGGGIFAVGTMLAAMQLGEASDNGMAIGAWGAVQATAIGVSLALGGFIRDGVNTFIAGEPGSALSAPAAGYSVVYHIELALLFACMVAIGPLVGKQRTQKGLSRKFGLAELPG